MTYGRSIHHQRLEMLVVAHRQVALVAARAASSPRTLSANHRSALRESLRPGRWRCPASLLAAGSAAAVGQTNPLARRTKLPRSSAQQARAKMNESLRRMCVSHYSIPLTEVSVFVHVSRSRSVVTLAARLIPIRCMCMCMHMHMCMCMHMCMHAHVHACIHVHVHVCMSCSCSCSCHVMFMFIHVMCCCCMLLCMLL